VPSRRRRPAVGESDAPASWQTRDRPETPRRSPGRPAGTDDDLPRRATRRP
jgi:hypothetical protein